MPNANYSCLLCGTTTPIPHVCPVFALPLSPPEEERSGQIEDAITALRQVALVSDAPFDVTEAALLAFTARIAQLEADLAAARSEAMDENDVRQILCRVFDDAMDEGGAYEQWRAWYNPADWLHMSRGFGVFLYTLVQPIRNERDAARSALKESYDRAYDLACVLHVDRPSESSRAQPMRFTEREIL